MFVLAAQAPLLIAALAAFILGIGLDIFYVVWITALQRKVPRESLSRVTSYDAMGSLMFGPIGLALAGPLISGAGAVIAFSIAGSLGLAAVIGALLFKCVRVVTNEIEVEPELSSAD
jgi:MFS family permease